MTRNPFGAARAPVLPGGPGPVRQAATVALLLGILLCGAARGAGDPPKVGDAAPPLSLSDLHGFPMKIPGEVRGKVAIVHFWTDSCDFCLVEMPAMENLYRKYRQRGLLVVAVNVGQAKRAVAAFVRNIRVTYPILLDPDMEAARRYGVDAVPRTYFLDRKGTVRFRILGDASESDLERLVRSLL